MGLCFIRHYVRSVFQNGAHKSISDLSIADLLIVNLLSADWPEIEHVSETQYKRRHVLSAYSWHGKIRKKKVNRLPKIIY